MTSTEPHSRIVTPIEPTHIVLESDDFETVRSLVCDAVGLFDGIVVHDMYELWLNNSLIHVRVNILLSTTSSSSFIVEFRKLRGCTVEFVKFFVSILRVFKHWATTEPPRVVVESKSAASSWAWIKEHSCNLSFASPPPLDLREDIMAVDEMLSPVFAMLRSEWGESKMNGLQSMCSITELGTNATILAANTDFLKALGTVDVSDRAPRDMMRCFAKTVANLYCAPRMSHTHILFKTISSFYLDILTTRLVKLHHIVNGRPEWYHVVLHIDRILRKQEARAETTAAEQETAAAGTESVEEACGASGVSE